MTREELRKRKPDVEEATEKANKVMGLVKNEGSKEQIKGAKVMANSKDLNDKRYGIKKVEISRAVSLVEEVMDELSAVKDSNIKRELDGLRAMLKTGNINNIRYAEEKLESIRNNEEYKGPKEDKKSEKNVVEYNIKTDDIREPVEIMEKVKDRLANEKDPKVIRELKEAKALVKTCNPNNIRRAKEKLAAV